MATKKLTILFAPLDGHGHINSCHGLAQVLIDRGHRIVFAIDIAFKGKLIPYGFEEALHGLSLDGSEVPEYWPIFVEKHAEDFLREPIEMVERLFLKAATKMFNDVKERDHQYIEILNRVKPDVILIDAYVCSPTLTNSGIPWVWLYSAAPHLCLNDDRLPPACSGLALNNDRNEWKIFKNKFNDIFSELRNDINKFCESKGAPKLENNRLHPESPYLNVYVYPKELDYEEIRPIPSNWRRVESLVRTTNDSFAIPESLSSRPGKLIFLSMGSFGCANLPLMTRLTQILGKSKHRFIVAKGPLHHKYELPENMFGEAFLPQTAILPIVDLIITHGGNNTVTEAFFYGKPMLVLPLFCDQLDNAMRIHETGLGLRLNPFFCTENELISAVDKLVSDEALTEKMRKSGERIRKSDDKKAISDLIEQMAK